MNTSLVTPQPSFTWSHRAVLGLLLTIPAAVWLISIGDPFAYLSHRVPPGQILYLLSKLCALYALAFMTSQVFLGIQGQTSPLFRFHPIVGMATATFVLLHLSIFIVAASLRSKHSTIETLIPVFDQGFYKSSISLGVIAAYLLIAVMISGFMRYRRKRFGLMHYLAYAVVILGFVHSFFIGSETRQPVVIGYYAILLAAVVVAIIQRIAQKRVRSN